MSKAEFRKSMTAKEDARRDAKYKDEPTESTSLADLIRNRLDEYDPQRRSKSGRAHAGPPIKGPTSSKYGDKPATEVFSKSARGVDREVKSGSRQATAKVIKRFRRAGEAGKRAARKIRRKLPAKTAVAMSMKTRRVGRENLRPLPTKINYKKK